MKILEVSHLTKIYGKGETRVQALNDVSFSVNRGEFVAITGPSGSGKSTLLHILGGVDVPTEGKVIIDGTDIYELNETKLAIFRRRQIGLIYQFYNLIPVLDVEENDDASPAFGWPEGRFGLCERADSYAGDGNADEAPAESAFRRTAAKGIHRAGAGYPSGPCTCR